MAPELTDSEPGRSLAAYRVLSSLCEGEDWQSLTLNSLDLKANVVVDVDLTTRNPTRQETSVPGSGSKRNIVV